MTIDAQLNKRLDRVVRKHQRMKSNGVVHRVGRDGLIRSRPRLIRPRFPLKGAMIILALLIAFKAVLFAQLGASNYGLRVEQLKSGNIVEQIGAVVMQEDRVSVTLASYIQRYVLRP